MSETDDPSAITKAYNWIHCSKALEPRPPRPYVLKDLLLAKTVNVLTGDSGTGKTLAAMDLGMCITLGKKWLTYEVTPGTVLFVDEESGADLFMDRLADALRGHMVEAQAADIPFYFSSLAGTNLASDPDVWAEQLLSAAVEYNASLIIIDSLVAVSAGVDENSTQFMEVVMLTLRKIAELSGCCILLIHHASKNGARYRGSFTVKSNCDFMMFIEKDGDALTFKSEKTRTIPYTEFTADCHFDGGQFWLSVGNTVEHGPRFSKSERYVMEYLQQHIMATAETIKAHADRCAPATARAALYALVDRGFAKRSDSGGRGEEATFTLTEAGRSACIALK